MKLAISLFILLLTSLLLGQSLEKSIGDFDNAGSFSISPTGAIFVTDLEKNELLKLDKNGKVIAFVGGFGWDNSSFDNPIDVYANTLRIYVADKNNNRIQIFDKYLNYLSSFSNEKLEDDESFAYPNGFGISNQGDYFILDSDNNRVLKYNLNGEFLIKIGDTDAGQYSLSNPKALAISPDGKVFVINNNQIFVYDQYGTGLLKINTKFSPSNINITSYYLTINSDSLIEFTDLSKPATKFNKFVPEETFSTKNKIVEASVFQNKIYVLTQKNILIYSLN